MRTENEEIRDHLKYLSLLARDYPSQAAAASEIISTQALLKLPKGTEHFMSDLHGENEAFVHILNSASGVIREKVDIVLGDSVPEQTRAELATLIYYPNEKLPQLKAEHRFDAARTVQALRLLALGLFKLVAVSDVLGLLVDEVFPNYSSYGGPMLVLAAVFYTFQLYFNFSGYSEVARAVGLLLGLTLPENFKTPFFATNFSGFWSRWHISFSSWLQDYLFMPLAWADVSGVTHGRLTRLPAEVCVFTVFFVSGFWHGNTLPFVVWGLLQACYRLGEELLHRRLGKPKKKAPARVQWAKRAGVFALWCVSMVFFRVGSSPAAAPLTVGDAFRYLGGCFLNWAPARFAAELYAAASNGFYANAIMVAAYYAFTALVLALAFYLDARRAFAFKNKPAEICLAKEKHRWAIYYALVIALLIGYIMQSGGFGSSGFGMYAGF